MDDILFLEFLQHCDKKPRSVRQRKDFFEEYDDGEFKKRFRLTKSTVNKLLEQVKLSAHQVSYFHVFSTYILRNFSTTALFSLFPNVANDAIVACCDERSRP